MLAKVTANSEWELEPDEAQSLTEAATRVSELYDMPVLDEKSAAWLALGQVAFGVYAPRVMQTFFTNKPTKKNDGPIRIPVVPAPFVTRN